MFFRGIFLACALLFAREAEAGKPVSISARTAKVLTEEKKEACRLSRRTKVEALATVEKSDLIQVKMKIKGCPQYGYIAKKQLKGSLKGLKSTTIDAPVVDCVECNRPKGPPADGNVQLIADLLEVLETQPDPFEGPSLNFWTLLKGWNRNTDVDERSLVQIPVLGATGTIGPCGSHHYNPEEGEPRGIDAFVTPLAGCVLTSVMQEWKKTHCPQMGGCTLSWGDASHGDHEEFPPHKSHGIGECVDIRPMRKGAFADSSLVYTDKDNYDQDTTRKLVELLRKAGAYEDQFFFNDTDLGTKS